MYVVALFVLEKTRNNKVHIRKIINIHKREFDIALKMNKP